jgi:carbonic anhydrase
MNRRIVLGVTAAFLAIALQGAAPTPTPACLPTNCTQQSPIDIVGAIPAQLGAVTVNYAAGPYRVTNDGHTIKVYPVNQGSSITVMGKTYPLAEFHFHRKSEHRVGGTEWPMEVHFVNKINDNDAAVIGVFMETEAANDAFNRIMSVAMHPGQQPVVVQINPNNLLPPTSQRAYWTYMGSLTTPAYAEVVRWIVMRTPVKVLGTDIAKFATFYPDNARKPEPLNRRFILSGP